MGDMLDLKLQQLMERGVEMIDARQVWVADDVSVERIEPEVVLYPGTRLQGKRTLLARGAKVGTEGPATLVDTVLGPGASIASGYANKAVLLRDASVGANAHLRDATLLEEQASTAHCVGLKHTILLSFVTMGSLINFCDCLMAGGTSRRDHSEVGSGVIHFNFTPWGTHGDKATASLFGDVTRGVFLREKRIFVGGTSGVVGPRGMGFGSVSAAGQVLRKDVGDSRLIATPTTALDRPFSSGAMPVSNRKVERNVEYIAQLRALWAWYSFVRRPMALEGIATAVVDAAIEGIEWAIAERRKRLDAYLRDTGDSFVSGLAVDFPEVAPCPITLGEVGREHIEWVQSLDDANVRAGSDWLISVAQSVRQTN